MSLIIGNCRTSVCESAHIRHQLAPVDHFAGRNHCAREAIGQRSSLVEAESFNARRERGRLYSQPSGGSVSTVDLAVGCGDCRANVVRFQRPEFLLGLDLSGRHSDWIRVLSARLFVGEFEAESSLRRHDAGPFQGMLKFADIARPVVPLQFMNIGQCESRRAPTQLPGETSEELFGQKSDACGEIIESTEHRPSRSRPLLESGMIGWLRQGEFRERLSARQRDHDPSPSWPLPA